MNKHDFSQERIETLLLEAAARFPDSCAISEWHDDQWKNVQFQALIKQAQAFSKQLADLKIVPGERVILISHNAIDAVAALLGIWMARGTAVLIDPELPIDEIAAQCQIADSRIAVIEKEIVPILLSEVSVPFLFEMENHHYEYVKQEVQPSKTVTKDCDHNIAVLLFTSGTAGESKAVMLTHQNFVYLMHVFEDYDLGGNKDRSLTVLPMFHVAGLLCGILEPLSFGTCVVFLREFSVDALQNTFQTMQPTVLITVPRLLEVFDQKVLSLVESKGKAAKFMFGVMLKIATISRRFFHINLGKIFFKNLHEKFGGHLKKILCGSASLPVKIQKRFLSYGFEMLFSYGLTETCGPITFTKLKDLWCSGSVGPCISEKDLAISASGEIIYCGPALMKGYFRDSKTTEIATKGGWFHTLDIGRLDRKHNLYVTGRQKELIVFSDGKKAMPGQIEKQYAGIAGMEDFAVLAVEQNANTIAALAFVPEEKFNPKIIVQSLYQKASRLKIPYRINRVYIVSEIPRSNTLKVKRYLLKEMIENQKPESDEITHFKASENATEIQTILNCFRVCMPDKKDFISPEISFAELGVDSLLAAQLCDKINTALQIQLKPTVFWFCYNIKELYCYIHPLQIGVTESTVADTHDHIAIIAMDCRFPGEAKDFDSFWDHLMGSKDAIEEVPKSRWNVDDYYDEYALAPGKMNTRYGGFIDLPTDFDTKAFNIKPRIAKFMDPQQKVVLTMTKNLLHNYDSSKKIEDWSGISMGVFLGAGFSDFMIQSSKETSLRDVHPYTGTGMADFSMAGRIAYHFGFSGPAMVIKTACSSALVAVHQAVRALQAGDCNVAIAGGINLMLIPDPYVCLTKGGFLSPDGRCKAFDESANGYVRSEGCGFVLLKRYKDAVKDGDKIMATIVGSAINQDGPSNGITAPNGKAQMACYLAALREAKISPHKITYLESHGTGTQLGDAIEMESIQGVYDQNRDPENALIVGAVKSSIGHCESAAGIAGLIKTIGVLQHQMVPPNLHYHQPNSNINFENSSVHLPGKITELSSHPCEYAAVSSFGVAGTNVHMILKVHNDK